MKTNKTDDSRRARDIGGGFGGFLSGLTGLLEKLNELSAAGDELRREGEIRGADGRLRGIYGFTIKTAGTGQSARVEPFGNIRTDKSTGRAVVEEVREPAVDLFVEKDHVLIVAEMPGISATDVKLAVQDDVLTITAAKGDKKYRKEVLLPGVYAKSKMRWVCNNGVVKITCGK